METNKSNCICPVCGNENCNRETTENLEHETRVCKKCGYMTTTVFKFDSPHVLEYEQRAPEIIIALKFKDTELGQYWYPSTLYIQNRGAIFPVGTKENWCYGFAPVVPIPIHERLQYPIPGKKDEYYEMRLAIEKIYHCNSFQEALDLLMENN